MALNVSTRALRRFMSRSKLARFSVHNYIRDGFKFSRLAAFTEPRSHFSMTAKLRDFEDLNTESKPHFVKIFESSDEAIKDIPSGCRLLVGGFGLVGVPENLIKALSKRPVKDLTVISNEGGAKNHGLDIMLHGKQVSKPSHNSSAVNPFQTVIVCDKRLSG